MNNDFIDRTLDLFVNPANEWARIQKEENSQDLQGVIKYLLIRIIPAIILNISTFFIGAVIIGIKTRDMIDPVRLSTISGVVASFLLIAGYVGTIVVGALVIKLIASSFDSEADDARSLKLIAFSIYPLLIIGSMHIIPGVRIGTLLGLCGIYVLYTGLPVLLKTPVEKSAGFTLVVSLAVIGMLAMVFYITNFIGGVTPTFRVGL
ncbi:hypothetical protein TI04_01655 [Achromatium sp. WMS2]|nr:hypothetical protein TI04_01655 [Achromatium sp. WMS2]